MNNQTIESKEEEEISFESQNSIIEEKSISPFQLRQVEQKQQLLMGLTQILFKKFEETHPREEDSKVEETKPEKKYTKFEFSDISWYKKLGSTK